MAVPDARVELQIGGVWTDTEDDLLHGEGIRYSWGRRAEGSSTDPAAASFSLRNQDGKYSGRNPRGPYYGLLGRNTPVRISHGGAAVAMILPAASDAGAATPDTAALDITGDIDVRADLTPSQWAGTTARLAWEVMGKYLITGDQRSWALLIQDQGTIQFRWSADGIVFPTAVSTQPVPFGPGVRGAIRATLDVNNGAAGRTVTFYTAPTMAGPWVQLGDPVVTAGVTSIFNSTAPLTVGDIPVLNFSNVHREVHAIEVRSGIGGSAVANPQFSAQADGTTSFADAAGRTWTLAGSATITNRRVRAVLEASEWSPQWGASGHDVSTPVEAAGVLRRLGQGTKQLASTLRRKLPTRGPVAYWPMEDGRTATQASSPLAGVAPLTTTGITFEADDTCPGSSPLPSVGAVASMQGRVPTYTSPTNGYLVSVLYSLDAVPASKSCWLGFSTTGTARRILLHWTSTEFIVDLYDATGALIASHNPSNTLLFGPDRWFRFDCSAQLNGGNVDFHLGWVDVEESGVQYNFSISGSPGLVTTIDTPFGTLMEGIRLGHLAVFPSNDASVWGQADNGYRGETASARIVRLGTEETVPVSAATGPGGATAMGPQRPDTLLDLLGQCEASDGGILYEDRQRAGLSYRSRTTLYNQTPKLTIPYGQLAPPLRPVDDDRHLRNDRTVQRIGGSSARAVLETGSLSIAAPPAGAGIYDDSQNLSLATDDQCVDIANWLVHRGTWDESRYPQLTIYLHKYPELIPAVSALQPGDIIRVTDLPEWLPPGPLDLMVEGASEELKTLSWTITLACSPAGPWTVAVTDESRADTDGSTLGTAATSSATTLVVHTTQSDTGQVPLWIEDPAQYPMDLQVGGEVVTATAAAPLAADTFTRTVGSGGWGTSSDGHTYTVTGGPASDRSVAATYGVITLVATPTTNRYMIVAESCRDCDIRGTFAVSATATGGSLVAGLIARWTAFTDYYRLRAEFSAAGGITLAVTRATSIVGSAVATGLSYTPGSTVEVRMRVIGDRVLGRAWLTGTVEPSTWHVDEVVTSTPISEGLVGLAGSGLTGNSNVSPEVRFHDWSVETPQRFTVVRGVNGITKEQPAGEAVSLADPAIVAL